MRTNFAFLAIAASLGATPSFAAGPADILAANKAATGGSALTGKTTLKCRYDYAGQGMTGKVTTTADLTRGLWSDSAAIGPATEANGFDGTHAWQKDPSGAVTNQDGGDQRQLAVNEGYRRANLWWQPDMGGAKIVSDGEKSEGGTTYDVLTVTPKDGKDFDAWFDAKTHLLERTVEKQGPQTITTTYSDYRAVGGVELAYKGLVSLGDPKYDQALTLTDASFTPAQDVAAYAAPKVAMADFTIDGGNQTTFPFHLYNNHIYADVSVDGKGPYQFIFDTGGVNLLTPPLVGELGLKSEGQMQGNGAGSGHMDVGLTKVSSLKLGNAVVKDQIFAVMPLQTMSNVEGVGMPGMVGFETFRRFVTRFDYGAGTITLIKPEAFEPQDAGTPVHFTFDGNTIEAPATLNGVSGTFTIDTGSRASITMNAPFTAAHHLAPKDRTAAAVTGWGVGGPTRSIPARGETLVIGGQSVRGPVVEFATDVGGAFANDVMAGNIGAGVLKHFVVTLDYEHTTMYLKPTAAAVADLDTFDRAGMWFNEGGEGYQVVDVTEGTPAAMAGFKAGDEITAVDGKPAKSIPLYEMRRRLRNEAPGTVVTFAVKGKGEVKVTLKDLI